MQSVTFKNRSIDMAGNLYLPAKFDENRSYPAIVVVHPGGGVKEQAAGLYAKLLAKEGFVTLAFDSSYQGASGGTPHFLDMPMNRTDDVYSAIDYVTTLPYVDNERIGIAGICAGGGYAAKASAIDRRVKAVATASAVNTGASARKEWEGKGTAHMDLYDGKGAVAAVNKMVPFFKEHLGSADTARSAGQPRSVAAE